MRKINLIGQKFGRLVILNQIPQRTLVCSCECGKIVKVDRGNVVSGKTKSCGCFKTEKSIKHGLHSKKNEFPEYSIWASMIGRCYCTSHTGYKNYGGRGISVCLKWRKSPLNFISDMGRRTSSKHSIERINNNGNYTPTNCRWATRKEQARNTRRSCFLKHGELRKTKAEWCEVTGIARYTLEYRLKIGWSVQDALTKPVRSH